MIFSFILKTTLISIVSLVLLTLSSIFLLIKG
jgi:hypothetical protein